MVQNSTMRSEQGFRLMTSLLEYDPAKRISAGEALQHPYFQEEPLPLEKYESQKKFLNCYSRF
jgi:cyclin-dependent kinase 8/11